LLQLVLMNFNEEIIISANIRSFNFGCLMHSDEWKIFHDWEKISMYA